MREWLRRTFLRWPCLRNRDIIGRSATGHDDLCSLPRNDLPETDERDWWMVTGMLDKRCSNVSACCGGHPPRWQLFSCLGGLSLLGCGLHSLQSSAGKSRFQQCLFGLVWFSVDRTFVLTATLAPNGEDHLYSPEHVEHHESPVELSNLLSNYTALENRERSSRLSPKRKSRKRSRERKSPISCVITLLLNASCSNPVDDCYHSEDIKVMDATSQEGMPVAFSDTDFCVLRHCSGAKHHMKMRLCRSPEKLVVVHGHFYFHDRRMPCLTGVNWIWTFKRNVFTVWQLKKKNKKIKKYKSFNRPAMVKLGTTMELCNAKSCQRERQKIEENGLQDSGHWSMWTWTRERALGIQMNIRHQTETEEKTLSCCTCHKNSSDIWPRSCCVYDMERATSVWFLDNGLVQKGQSC